MRFSSATWIARGQSSGKKSHWKRRFTAAARNGRGGFGADFNTFSGTLAGNGGVGTGGSATLAISGGLFLSDTILLSATGNASQIVSFGEGNFNIVRHGGGGAVFGEGQATGGTGGLGVGGTTSLTMTGGSLANTSSSPTRSITLDSRGVGGNGGDANTFSANAQLTRGSGGAGRGGTSNFTLLSGATDFTVVTVNAGGFGGASGQDFGSSSAVPSSGGNGGSGFGGNASIVLATAVSATDAFGNTRRYSALANGFAADGGGGAVGGSGGNGQGGTVL